MNGVFTASHAGRLDQLLVDHLETLPQARGFSRSQVKRWIENGSVKVSSFPQLKAGFLVRAGEIVEFCATDPARSTPCAYEFPLDVVFEDPSLLVINKPAGLSVHPRAGNLDRTLVNALVAHFSKATHPAPQIFNSEHIGSSDRPGIVHRLDKDTTGLVVVAKTFEAHQNLSQQFARRSAKRKYCALAFITPRGKRALNTADSGTIDKPLGRHESRRKEIAVVADGRKAVTHWRVLDRFHYACLLELQLETGRTHQIRVHLESIGCPVIGDRTYGNFSGLPAALNVVQDQFGRQALHAAKLEFEHPVTAFPMQFEAKVPADMQALIKAFREFRTP